MTQSLNHSMTQFPPNHLGKDSGVGALRVAGTKNQSELPFAGVLHQFFKESFARGL